LKLTKHSFSAIQTTQGSNITGNIIVGNTHIYAIGVIPNQGTPAAVKIEGNTIFNGNTASIYVGGYQFRVSQMNIINMTLLISSEGCLSGMEE